MKSLIINADDFGYSRIFNEEILKLINEGLVTSTTVMVNWVDSSQDKQIAELIQLSETRDISVGLHLEFENTNFRNEINSQFEKFKKLFSFNPSHIDLHKWAYIEDSYPAIQNFCKKNNLACRSNGINTIGVLTTDGEAFSTMRKSFEEIKSWIESLEDNKTYEILFHPGIYDPNSKSSFNKERENDVWNIKELDKILDKNNIKLINFFDLKPRHKKTH